MMNEKFGRMTRNINDAYDNRKEKRGSLNEREVVESIMKKRKFAEEKRGRK